MAIHTSAITYTRGLPKNYNNFFFVAQANNTIIEGRKQCKDSDCEA